MRTLAVAASTAFALIIAGAASAVPVVSLTWTGTTGTGATGGSSIDAQLGDVVTLTINVSNTSPAQGISFAGVSLTFGGNLTGLTAAECPTAGTSPSGSNLFGGGTTCTPTGFVAPFMAPFALGVVIGPGLISSFDAGAPAPQFTTGTINLGAASFSVGGSETVNTFYVPGLDSVNDGLFSVYFPGASASVVVPEPATAGLLALGLGALALAGRRR